jgi:hypothetical protein
MLLQARSNPSLPASQREFADKLLTRWLDESKTPEIKTLQQLKAASGYQGSILDLEKELKVAGAIAKGCSWWLDTLFRLTTHDGTIRLSGEISMIEFLVVAGVVSAVGGAVASGISYGSRYVDQKLRYEEQYIRPDQPILASPAQAEDKFREKNAA